MPIYEYECNSCGTDHEFIQKFSEGPKRKCPACGALRLRKKVSAAAFHLKGSGWYVTDFRDKDKDKANGKEKDTETKEKDTETKKSSDDSSDSTTKSDSKSSDASSKSSDASSKSSDSGSKSSDSGSSSSKSGDSGSKSSGASDAKA